MSKKHKYSKNPRKEASTNLNPFDLLDEELIFAILDRIHDDPLTKKSISLVCISFYRIESKHRKTLKPLRSELLDRTLRRYPHISELDLCLCPRIADNALNAIASNWKSSLRSINLSRSRFFTSSGLSSLVGTCLGLVEINLSNWTELTDKAAAAIAEAKSLERLWLGRCKLISDMGIGCIAVGCKNLRLICLKWCLRLTDLGVGLIAMKCKEIRSLDLSYLSQITEKCLPHILQLQHLENLVIEGCLGIDDDGLATLKESCKSLKALNMSNCQNINHIGLASLTNGSECLQHLILTYGSSITEDLARSLQKLSGLQSINLYGCAVTSSGIKSIGNWKSSLKELCLGKCSGLTDESLSYLVERHKELKKIDITCCGRITYASIDSITSSCTSLTSLKMESCGSVSQDAFVLIGQRCHFLEELDVTDNEIEDKGLESISRCSELSTLKCGICLNITDDGLTYVGNGCPKLKELDLYRSLGITDVGIAAIARGCPTLEMINIAYNDKITDASLVSLSKCLRLNVLEIRGCALVSPLGLSAIAVGCRNLTVMDIKKCCNINDAGMLPLAKFSQSLQQINLSYCSVTDVGLLALARINRLQNMTILHLSGLTPNGLAAALLACAGLTKVKLHAAFKLLLPQSLLSYIEDRGCMFHWRDKAFQEELDPKGWRLHLGRTAENP